MKLNNLWVRHFFTANLAVGVTILILLIMQGLIAMESPAKLAQALEPSTLIPFPTKIISEPTTTTEEYSNPPPSPVSAPDTSIPNMGFSAVTPQMFAVGEPSTSTEFAIKMAINYGGGYSQYLPQIQVQPIYPPTALRKGIKGYVVVELTVSKSGRVKHPIIRSSVPRGVFDRAVLQAVRKYRFKPRLINDEPTEVSGVTYKINFDFN